MKTKATQLRIIFHSKVKKIVLTLKVPAKVHMTVPFKLYVHLAPPVKVKFLILTDYHPCNGKTCPFYGVCQAPTKTTHKCVCLPCTTDESAPLCDNNDVTHKNKCEYNYHVCKAQEEPGIKHYGGCKRKSLFYVAAYLAVRYQHCKIG